MRSPRAHTDTADLRFDLLLGLSDLIGIRQRCRHGARAYVVGHHLLYIIRRSAEHTGGVVLDHIRAPTRLVDIGKDGRVAGHAHDVGIVFHTHHEHGLAQSGIQITHLTEALRHGILADIDFRATTVVVIIVMEVLGKPRRRTIVVLVDKLGLLL